MSLTVQVGIRFCYGKRYCIGSLDDAFSLVLMYISSLDDAFFTSSPVMIDTTATIISYVLLHVSVIQ